MDWKPRLVAIAPCIAACFALGARDGRAQAAESAQELLRAEFDKDALPFRVASPPRFEGGAAVIAAGSKTVLTSVEPICGDFAVELHFTAAYSGALEFKLGDPLLVRAERTVGGPGALKLVRLVVRSSAIELIDGETPSSFQVLPIPTSGGALEVVIAPTEEVRLDSLVVQRLPFAGRDEIEGLDADRLARMIALPKEKFTLLPPLPTRIDPVYCIAVEGEKEPIVARGRGVREDEAKIPLLDQALAITCIRPFLKYSLVDGDDPSSDQLLKRESENGPYVITKPPGIVRVTAQCGMTGQWPSLVLMDATRNRVLFRSTPSGPASADIFSVIPAKCDRLRIALVIPNRATIEEFVDLKRP